MSAAATVPVRRLVSKIGSGKTPTGGSEVYVDNGVTFLRSQNVLMGQLKLDDAVYISAELDAGMANTRTVSNDVLLNITGASIGRVASVPSWLGRANVNQHVCILRPTDPGSGRFIEYALQAHQAQAAIRLAQVGGNRDGLNFEQVADLPVPDRSAAEQRAIADYLDTATARIDALITKKQQLTHLLEERWVAELASTFSASGTGARRRVGAYAEVVLGRQRSPKHEAGDYQKQYLRAANVKSGYLDLSDIKSMNFDPSETARFRLLPGDVLVTEGSGSRTAVGASAVWNGEISGSVCFQNTLIRMRPRSGVSADFLAWWAQFAHKSGLFAEIAGGANIFHLSAERVRDVPMRSFSESDQHAVSQHLDRSWAVHRRTGRKLEQQLICLSERRQSLITAAVSGKLTFVGATA